jgi:hypothetical protein
MERALQSRAGGEEQETGVVSSWSMQMGVEQVAEVLMQAGQAGDTSQHATSGGTCKPRLHVLMQGGAASGHLAARQLRRNVCAQCASRPETGLLRAASRVADSGRAMATVGGAVGRGQAQMCC